MQKYFLKRKKISDALHHIYEYPMTLAVAAMGYGKSTATRDFLIESKANYVWLSVESDESSPKYIWDVFMRKLSKSKPEIGAQLRLLGFPMDTPQKEKVLRIIEEHNFGNNTIVVIDDYHYIHSPEMDRFFEYLISSRIEGLHILILTRTVPLITIDEFILKGFCHRINTKLFEMSIAEIIEFFSLCGHDLSEDMAHKVYDLSEGWVSAVYLLLKNYEGMGELGSGSSIERLIETAVICRYSDEEMMLLKKLSVLDEFSSEQAIFVTENRAATKMILKLSNGNSFIRYDEYEEVFTTHKLFNGYFKRLLMTEQGDIEINNNYKRCGQWYISHGNIMLGLKYYVKASEYELVLLEFEKSSITEIINKAPDYIVECFESIPIVERMKHPIAYITYIGFYITNIDKQKGMALLLEVEEQYLNCNSISPVMKRRIEGEIELIQAYVAFNDVSLMHMKMKKAHTLLEGRSAIANKDKVITFGSPHTLYLYYKDLGKLLWTLESLEKTFPYYHELSGGCGKGFEYQIRGEYYLEIGDLKEAELNVHKSLYKARTLHQYPVIICSNFVLARIRVAEERYEEAIDIVHELSAEIDGLNRPTLSSEVDIFAGYMGGILGQEELYAKWLRTDELDKSDVLYQGIGSILGINYIVYGKYLLLKKEFLKLEVLCEEMQIVFSYNNNQLGFLHMNLLKAIAKYKLYGFQAAEKHLYGALGIGEADGIITPIVEYGRDLMALFESDNRNHGSESYWNLLQTRIKPYINCYEPVVPIEFTKREKEIVQLIIDGKTNKKIAQQLFIAEVTVRKNITIIYRKLNVTGRTSAVKKIMELKII